MRNFARRTGRKLLAQRIAEPFFHGKSIKFLTWYVTKLNLIETQE